MSEKKKIGIKITRIGTGFINILLVAFIPLKATGTIACSWWWVAPLSIPIFLVLLALMIFTAHYILSDPIREYRYNRKKKEERKWDIVIDDLLKSRKLVNPKKEISKNGFSLKRWWKEGCISPTLWQRFSTWYKEGNEKIQ